MAKNKPAGTEPEVVALVKVRVLTQCIYGPANAVASLLPEEVESAQNSGLIDSDPDAVAYAESLTA